MLSFPCTNLPWFDLALFLNPAEAFRRAYLSQHYCDRHQGRIGVSNTYNPMIAAGERRQGILQVAVVKRLEASVHHAIVSSHEGVIADFPLLRPFSSLR
jgi:hypothetical protein